MFALKEAKAILFNTDWRCQWDDGRENWGELHTMLFVHCVDAFPSRYLSLLWQV
jgi:hypothetical protein